jgi:CPA2 family monovalent cation:H+ antiporter-2
MPLLVTLAAVEGLAFVLVAARLKLSVLVACLAADVIIGPPTPRFVTDVSLAQRWAEIGVMPLMIGVGMH